MLTRTEDVKILVKKTSVDRSWRRTQR